jgi:hypothetical protein
MNSPPDSTRNSGSSVNSSHQVRRQISPRTRAGGGSTSPPNTDRANNEKPGPPSPASTGTAIAVGSCNEEALYNGLEKANVGGETMGITTTIRDHIYEGGLRYHAYHAGKYAFPNDEAEQDRDDMKHSMTVQLCGNRLFYSPVESLLEKGGDVLDLGTLLALSGYRFMAKFHGHFQRNGLRRGSIIGDRMKAQDG